MFSKRLKSTFVIVFFLAIIYLQGIVFTDIHVSLLSFVGCLISGYVFADIWLLTTCKYLHLNGSQQIKGIHLHHSSISFIGLLIAITYMSNVSWLWLAWSIGIFIQHTLDEGRFVFISKA